MSATGTITSANAIVMLSIPGLFTTPQQLQQFSAEDIFESEDVDPVEVQMTIDGHLSAGWIAKEVKQGFTLNGDSASIDIFETWYRQQQFIRDVYFANGSIVLTAIGKSYTMVRGVLAGYSPTSAAKKVLMPRKFTITWESVTPQPI